MSLQAQQFLEFARDHCAGPSEASHRSCASRAYFAAFHSCLQLMQPLPEAEDGAGLHSRLIGILKTRSETREMALMLAQARDFQLEADYNLDSNFSRQQAHQALELASRILEQAVELGR